MEASRTKRARGCGSARRSRRTAGTSSRRGGAAAIGGTSKERAEVSRRCRPAKTSPTKPRRLRSVSWFVGRAGLVMLTTDGGKTFTKMNLAEPLDLATVTATDAKSATVMTTAGRRFRTNDGGRTWRPI